MWRALRFAQQHAGYGVVRALSQHEGCPWPGRQDVLLEVRCIDTGPDPAGTGARFALLPPDNASGNFTKVVQRVPVLIRLAPHEGAVLRPGMSVDVTVHTK